MVIVISTLDNSGGAGMLADAREIYNHRSHPFVIQSGIAVQNNDSVLKIKATDILTFESMIDSLLLSKFNLNFKEILKQEILKQSPQNSLKNNNKSKDIIKIGLICDIRQVQYILTLSNILKCDIVLDIPIISTTGYSITSPKIAKSIFTNLLPITTLFTPNKHELDYFDGMDNILSTGLKNILVKGIEFNDFYQNHHICNFIKKFNFFDTFSSFLDNNSIYDILVSKSYFRTTQNNDYFSHQNIVIFKSNKINIQTNVRGTGCAFSSIISANLSNNLNLIDSIMIAKKRIYQGILNSYYEFGSNNFLSNTSYQIH